MFYLKLLLNTTLFMAITLVSVSCKKQEAVSMNTTTSEQRIITATIASTTSHLFYSGSIQPLNTNNIISPVDGVIDDLYFSYGDQVTKGQVLMKITSTKSQQDYATALTNYIKDKDQYLQNKRNFEGTTALFKAGIVDREDYLNQKSQLATSELAYINSTTALRAIIKKKPGAPQNIENLTLQNVAAIEKMLQKQYDEFSVVAPLSGIALTPEKSGTSDNSGGSKTLSAGSEIKQNQIAVSIGDMSGISVTINVSETDINKIATGQAATLNSSALPGLLFYGKVTTVGKQAKTGEGGGGLANFPVVIMVPEITPLERNLIKVGMSIKVDLAITSQPQIKIPIAAVFTSASGESMVTIIDPKSGKPRDIVVEPGTTDIDNVTILNGLKPGDKVIVGSH